MAHQLPVAGVVEAVIDGVREGCRTLWCAGEAYRYYEPDLRRSRLSARAGGLLAHRDQITALDLAGDELGFPEICSFLISTARVMRAGILPSMQAKRGPESIWQAIRELGGGAYWTWRKSH